MVAFTNRKSSLPHLFICFGLVWFAQHSVPKEGMSKDKLLREDEFRCGCIIDYEKLTKLTNKNPQYLADDHMVSVNAQSSHSTIKHYLHI